MSAAQNTMQQQFIPNTTSNIQPTNNIIPRSETQSIHSQNDRGSVDDNQSLNDSDNADRQSQDEALPDLPETATNIIRKKPAKKRNSTSVKIKSLQQSNTSNNENKGRR